MTTSERNLIVVLKKVPTEELLVTASLSNYIKALKSPRGFIQDFTAVLWTGGYCCSSANYWASLRPKDSSPPGQAARLRAEGNSHCANKGHTLTFPEQPALRRSAVQNIVSTVCESKHTPANTH